MNKPELLSPAGNMEALKSAIHNGADAVYIGGKNFGARKFADNFDEKEMIQAIKYAHLYNIKIYVIPYKTLGNEEKVLFGIKPEYIRLREENNYYSDDVIIGLYDGKISQNDSYFGLIGIDLFEKE